MWDLFNKAHLYEYKEDKCSFLKCEVLFSFTSDLDSKFLLLSSRKQIRFQVCSVFRRTVREVGSIAE